ncbi:MAG: hypothetical protein K6A69_06195 [Lachnospiraceae bacterium]|nr:hypothetical protein [Lachnospiraceae bacterium]
MSELTIFNYTTLILDLGTIVMLIGLLMVTNVLRQRGRADDKLFFYMVIIAMVIAGSDIVGYLADGKSFFGAPFVQQAGMQVFYLTFTLEAMVWTYYADVRFKGWHMNYSILRKVIFYIPGFILLTTIFINSFNGCIFYVSEENVYYRGPLFIPMYVVIVFYFIWGFATMTRYRNAGTGRSLIPLWIYFMPIILGVVVTFILGSTSLAPVGIAVSIMFTHLGSMNEITDTEYEEGEV